MQLLTRSDGVEETIILLSWVLVRKRDFQDFLKRDISADNLCNLGGVGKSCLTGKAFLSD